MSSELTRFLDLFWEQDAANEKKVGDGASVPHAKPGDLPEEGLLIPAEEARRSGMRTLGHVSALSLSAIAACRKITGDASR